jgi:hypothetical protein
VSHQSVFWTLAAKWVAVLSLAMFPVAIPARAPTSGGLRGGQPPTSDTSPIAESSYRA